MNPGFKITGAKLDQIGQLAFDAKLPVLELSEQNTSLEDAFLDLTASSEEYVAKEAKI
jgi:ABC-2 type transport system ATP-binding protein